MATPTDLPPPQPTPTDVPSVVKSDTTEVKSDTAEVKSDQVATEAPPGFDQASLQWAQWEQYQQQMAYMQQYTQQQYEQYWAQYSMANNPNESYLPFQTHQAPQPTTDTTTESITKELTRVGDANDPTIQRRTVFRKGGQTEWEDPTLLDWPESR